MGLGTFWMAAADADAGLSMVVVGTVDVSVPDEIPGI